MILNRNEVLLAKDIVKELVHIPEWGGDVYVRGMSGEARDKFEMLILQTSGKNKRNNTENFRAKLASMTVCDENGDLLFSEDDVKELAKKSAAALQRIFIVSQRLSRIGNEDVKELAAGLQENPLEGSASVSP